MRDGRRSPHTPSTPARCTRRSARSDRARARSAAWRWSRSRSPPTRGPNPELIDMTRRFWIGLALTVPVFVLEMGGHLVGLHHAAAAAALELGRARAGDARRAVGGLAVLRARLGVARDAQPQHVHADRAGHRRGVRLQRRRDVAPRHLPGGVPRPRRRGRRSTSRRRRSSPCWCCSARCSSSGRASRRRGAIRALLDLAPKTARRIRPTAREKTCRSTRSRSAIACACGPARRCRSTASWSKAAARSTNRW